MYNRTNTNNPNNQLRFEVRKVQQQSDGRSLLAVIPSTYAKRMNLRKGDLLKSYLDGGRLLIYEKVDLSPSVVTATEIGDSLK